jgi:hypothetical protein
VCGGRRRGGAVAGVRGGRAPVPAGAVGRRRGDRRDDRSRLELALATALHRSGDLPGSQETAAGVGRRAERRRDRGLLARTALVMEATGVPEWDGEICRICEQALAGDDLPDGLRARVSSRYAQALVYRGEYDRAGQVSRDALAAPDRAGDPVALVDALRARQLACCAPDGVTERAVLASRMLEAADAAGSAWLEMWGRLWRIDTLLETGQLRSVRRELADLEGCVERLPGPLAQWHFLETSATLALATGRFTEATQLAWQAFKVFNDMGHPVAFGGCSVILGQAGLHIGFGRSGLIELFGPDPRAPAAGCRGHHPRHGTVFPALTLALIRLHQGDRAAAEAAYALAGPVRSWTPVPAMRMAAWAHGLAVAIGLGRAAGHRVPGGAVRAVPRPARRERRRAGVLHGPGRAAARTGGRRAGPPGPGGRGPARRRSRSATPTAPAGAPCKPASSSPPRSPAGRRRATGTEALAALAAAAREAERLGMVPFTERIETAAGPGRARPPRR